jgi:3-deoxy-D-manno-octulosonic-acid transferase
MGYRAIAPLAGAAAPLVRGLLPDAEQTLWSERLGQVDAGEPADVWIHAASLGEALAVGGLMKELVAHAAAARFRLTATTRAGRERLGALGVPSGLAPLDTPQAITCFLGRVRPRRAILIETELWPHWLMAARAAALPVAVLSARLSARSLERYRWLGHSFAELVAGLGAVLCQSEADRDRWLALGAPVARTAAIGNLKNDGLPVPVADRGAARAALGLDPRRPLLTLGNVRPGEGATLAAAWRSLPETIHERWQVAAVPRHPHAAPGVRREIEAAGVKLGHDVTAPPGAWGWDDRAGVLASYYCAGEVAVVGGSFGPYGGHNPLEPAACGAAVVAGPHLESQRPAAEALTAAGGLEIVTDDRALAAALRSVLEDDALRERRATAALATANAARGATRRAVTQLVEWGWWPA